MILLSGNDSEIMNKQVRILSDRENNEDSRNYYKEIGKVGTVTAVSHGGTYPIEVQMLDSGKTSWWEAEDLEVVEDDAV